MMKRIKRKFMAQTEQTIQKFVGNLFAWEFRGRIHVSRPTQHLRNFSLHTLRARTQKKNSHGFDDFIEWCIVFVKLIKFWRRQWINYRNTNGRHVLHGGAISHQKPSDSIRYGSMWLIIVAPVLALELIFFFFFCVQWTGTHHSQYLARPVVNGKKSPFILMFNY